MLDDFLLEQEMILLTFIYSKSTDNDINIAFIHYSAPDPMVRAWHTLTYYVIAKLSKLGSIFISVS